MFIFRSSLLLCTLVALIAFDSSMARARTLKQSASFKNYKVNIYSRENGDDNLEISKNGTVIQKMEGSHFYIGYPYTQKEFAASDVSVDTNLIGMGKDITGDGIPDMVICEWDGGAHCCFKFHIFEIGKKFRKIGLLDAEDGDLAHFKKMPGEKGLIFVAADWTYAYWHASFSESPAPEILLRFRDGRYRLALDLMHHPVPSAGVTEKQIKQVRTDQSWEDEKPPASLWGFMLDLIYSGNATAAWQFFEKAWVPHVKGKAEFLTEFRSKLTTSPYWKDLSVSIGDARNWKRKFRHPARK